VNLEFTCAACNTTFEKAWTDEERDAEYADRFGGDPTTADVAVVCDDCYRAMGLGR
jgi:hypothetical protein